MKKDCAWSWGSHRVDEAKEKVEEARRFAEGGNAVKRASQSVDWAREKVQGVGDEL